MKIGDRVRVKNNSNLFNSDIKVNDQGKIICFKDGFYFKYVGVEFDKDINGHDCEGHGKKNKCAWITKKHLQEV